MSIITIMRITERKFVFGTNLGGNFVEIGSTVLHDDRNILLIVSNVVDVRHCCRHTD